MNTKNNRRSQDSVTRLSVAFLELVEKPVSQRITVRQVCERAGVNRSTFYSHFRDIYDIVENAEAVLLDELHNELHARCSDGEISIDSFFSAILEHDRKHYFFYAAIVRSDADLPALQRSKAALRRYCEDVIRSQFRNADPVEMEYYTAYFQAGLHEVIHRWIKGGCRESDQQMQVLLRNCTPKLMDSRAEQDTH